MVVQRHVLRRLVSIALVCLACGSSTVANARDRNAKYHRSVVKIYATTQRANYAAPWQSYRPSRGTGTGFVVAKKRILTNAHVVSNARSIEVQKHQEDKRYTARVSFIAHDCDVAMLEVDDPSFFDGMTVLPFAKRLPALTDEVSVMGYPMGGSRLSVTRGVVSRIDYSLYSHSAVDSHLVLQVDAAINPGNSGGPVLFGGKVVGIAFQGIGAADNIGYAIPIPVIERFLADVSDGKYHGYPELGVSTLSLRNPALRADLKLPKDKTGIPVSYIDPYGAARDLLKTRDVLMAIDGHTIDNDGSVQLDDTSVEFMELLERKQWGDAIVLDVWRNGASLKISVPLKNLPDPYIFRNEYDRKPEYYVLGGLVFSPLTREYLRTLGRSAGHWDGQQLYYYSVYAKIDDLANDRDEFVVLIARLPHPANTYDAEYVNAIVDSINGHRIRNLEDVKKGAAQPKGGFHVIKFMDDERTLVMDAKSVRQADPVILKRYGVPSPEHFRKTPVRSHKR